MLILIMEPVLVAALAKSMVAALAIVMVAIAIPLSLMAVW